MTALAIACEASTESAVQFIKALIRSKLHTTAMSLLKESLPRAQGISRKRLDHLYAAVLKSVRP